MLVAALSLLGVFAVSCSGGIASKSSQEGILEFDTKGVDPKHPLYDFAPSSATMKFKNEKMAIEMSVMGMFNTAILVDNKKKTMAQTVKFLDIKQACIEKEKDIEEENLRNQLKIEETGDTKKILGFKCRKLHVTKMNDPSISFDAWYTKDLGAEDCNALTPYAGVKGMLMDYRVERMGMELHFVAKHFNQVEVPDKTFDVPASMKIISKEEMQKFIEGLK